MILSRASRHWRLCPRHSNGLVLIFNPREMACGLSGIYNQNKFPFHGSHMALGFWARESMGMRIAADQLKPLLAH